MSTKLNNNRNQSINQPGSDEAWSQPDRQTDRHDSNSSTHTEEGMTLQISRIE
jgi:hypothetical protein